MKEIGREKDVIMESAFISSLATNCFNIIQPYIPVIALSAADEIGKKVPEAIVSLWKIIKNKFEAREAAREAMNDILVSSDNPAFQVVFKVQLEKLLTQDQEFLGQIHDLIGETKNKGQVSQQGDGAVAVGDHSVAIGKGGTYIGGNATNNTINSDNH